MSYEQTKPCNLPTLIGTLRHHTSAETHRVASARACCNEQIDVLYRERDSPDEISNVWLLDLHLLPSCSLFSGGYCAGLIKSKTMLGGCLDEV